MTLEIVGSNPTAHPNRHRKEVMNLNPVAWWKRQIGYIKRGREILENTRAFRAQFSLAYQRAIDAHYDLQKYSKQYHINTRRLMDVYAVVDEVKQHCDEGLNMSERDLSLIDTANFHKRLEHAKAMLHYRMKANEAKVRFRTARADMAAARKNFPDADQETAMKKVYKFWGKKDFVQEGWNGNDS